MDTQKPEDEYILLQDAADLMHYRARQLKRFIAASELVAQRPNRNTILVSKNSINAYHAKHGVRVIDQAAQANERITKLELALGKVLLQLTEQSVETTALKEELANLKVAYQREIAGLTEQIRALAGPRGRKPKQNAAQRRGFPADWERLPAFARKQDIEENIMRSAATFDSTLVTLYQSHPGARHEWWLSPEQQERMLARLHNQDIAPRVLQLTS